MMQRVGIFFTFLSTRTTRSTPSAWSERLGRRSFCIVTLPLLCVVQRLWTLLMFASLYENSCSGALGEPRCQPSLGFSSLRGFVSVRRQTSSRAELMCIDGPPLNRSCARLRPSVAATNRAALHARYDGRSFFRRWRGHKRACCGSRHPV
jgi:hypothetical protein